MTNIHYGIYFLSIIFQYRLHSVNQTFFNSDGFLIVIIHWINVGEMYRGSAHFTLMQIAIIVLNGLNNCLLMATICDVEKETCVQVIIPLVRWWRHIRISRYLTYTRDRHKPKLDMILKYSNAKNLICAFVLKNQRRSRNSKLAVVRKKRRNVYLLLP